ncbi:MAG: hypothetical protein OER96_05155 [Gammaproteobacteria bacterium]|nr:hypothetical protein [Gammaproteobacteria bacterium]
MLEKDPDNHEALAALVKVKVHLDKVVESLDTEDVNAEDESLSTEESVTQDAPMAVIPQIKYNVESPKVRSPLNSQLGIAAVVSPILLVAAYFYFSGSEPTQPDIKVADNTLPIDISIDSTDSTQLNSNESVTNEDLAVVTQSEKVLGFTSSIVPDQGSDELKDDSGEDQVANAIANEEKLDDILVTVNIAIQDTVNDSVNVATAETKFPVDTDATTEIFGEVENSNSLDSTSTITQSLGESPDSTETVIESTVAQSKDISGDVKELDLDLSPDLSLATNVAQSVVTEKVMDSTATNESVDVVAYAYDSDEIAELKTVDPSGAEVEETEKSQITISDDENTKIDSEETIEQDMNSVDETENESVDIVPSESELLSTTNNEIPASNELAQLPPAQLPEVTDTNAETTLNDDNSDDDVMAESQDAEIDTVSDDTTEERVKEIVVAILEKEIPKEVETEADEITSEQTNTLLDETQPDSDAVVEDETAKVEKKLEEKLENETNNTEIISDQRGA